MGNASFSKVIRFIPSRTHIVNMPIDGGESDLDLGNYERYITLLYSVPSVFQLTLLCKILGSESHGGGQFFLPTKPNSSCGPIDMYIPRATSQPERSTSMSFSSLCKVASLLIGMSVSHVLSEERKGTHSPHVSGR
jgi:hypothetical protein